MSDSGDKFRPSSIKRGETISTLDFGPSSNDDYFSGPVKKPPTNLLYIASGSIALGIILGGFGLSLSGKTTMQFIVGGLGYVFTALIPIVLLQIIRSKHISAMSNKDEAYDTYAGELLQARYLKVVLFGLITAALPLWVAISPIAAMAART